MSKTSVHAGRVGLWGKRTPCAEHRGGRGVAKRRYRDGLLTRGRRKMQWLFSHAMNTLPFARASDLTRSPSVFRCCCSGPRLAETCGWPNEPNPPLHAMQNNAAFVESAPGAADPSTTRSVE